MLTYTHTPACTPECTCMHAKYACTQTGATVKQTHLLHHANKLRKGPVELVHQRVKEASRQRCVVQQRLGQQTLEHLGWTWFCTHTHTHTHIHTVQKSACVQPIVSYACIHTDTHTDTRTHTHTRMHAHTHACVRTHTHVLQSACVQQSFRHNCSTECLYLTVSYTHAHTNILWSVCVKPPVTLTHSTEGLY